MRAPRSFKDAECDDRRSRALSLVKKLGFNRLTGRTGGKVEPGVAEQDGQLRMTTDAVQLPVELILVIFELALSTTSSSSNERSSLLATISLLCHGIHGWARAQLYVAPNLHGKKQIKLFLRCLRRNKSGENRRMVERLALSGKNDGVYWQKKLGKSSLKDILRECTEIQVLSIDWVKDLRLEVIGQCQNLSALSISNCTVVKTLPHDFRLRTLKQLSLRCTLIPTHLSKILLLSAVAWTEKGLISKPFILSAMVTGDGAVIVRTLTLDLY